MDGLQETFPEGKILDLVTPGTQPHHKELLFSQPDWLREPRGYDVSKDMNWIPVVTFLQVAADMAVAVDVPDGHGHRYVKDVVNAWAAVLQPPGWTPEKTATLRGRVTQDYPQ